MKARIIAGMMAAILLATGHAVAGYGVKTTTDKIVMALTEPLDASGLPKKPDSVHIDTYLETGTAAAFQARSTTYPFDAIGIDTLKRYGDTTYFFTETVSNIDGAGCNCELTVVVTFWTAALPTITSADFQLTTQTFHAGFVNLDAAITSRLAPTVAARTLDVAATGEAGLDLGNTVGTLDAAEIGSAALTAAKYAADVPKMFADTLLGKDTTSHDYPAGSWGQILETPSYVQGAASGLDSAIISRIVGRKVWGIAAGIGASTDSSTLAQRIIDSTGMKRIVSLAVYAIDTNLTIGTATYADSIRTMGYWLAPENYPSIAQLVDSIWDEDSTGHYTSPNLAFTTAQGGVASITNAQMAAISDSVWNKLFTTVFTVGSMGDSLNNASWVRGLSHVIGTALGDSVWKADTTGRTTPGSLGETQNLNEYASASNLGKISADSTWGKAFTTAWTSGSMGDSLNNPTYVQGLAAGLDSAVVSRIIKRNVYGLPQGVGSDSTTLAQRLVTVAALLANTITSTAIQDGAIGAPEIGPSAITSSELADGAITNTKFASSAIDNVVMATNSIGSDEIADNSIDAGAISTDAIGDAEIANLAFAASAFAPNAFTNTTIADGFLTNSKFGADALNASNIADGTIDGATFATDAITAAAIQANAFGASELAIDAVNEIADLVNDSVWGLAFATAFPAGSLGDSINNATYVQGAAAGVTDASVSTAVWNKAFNTAFTAGSMGDSLNNSTYVQGAAAGLDSGIVSRIISRKFGIAQGAGSDSLTVAQRTVTTQVIANEAITAAAIAPDAITSSEIANGAFDAGAFADNSITAATLANDAIGADEIAGDAIGANEMATDAIGALELAGSAAKEIKDSVGASSALAGQYTQTITVKGLTGTDTAGAVTVSGAKVSVNNVAQTNTPAVIYSLITGKVSFGADAGTYAILTTYPGYNSKVDTITVSGVNTARIVYVTKSATAPKIPTIYANLRTGGNSGVDFAVIEYQIIGRDRIAGTSPTQYRETTRPIKFQDTLLVGPASIFDTADATGYVTTELFSNTFMSGPDSTFYQVVVRDRYGTKVRYWSDFKFRLDTATAAINLASKR